MIEMPAILITIMGSQPLKSVVCHCLIAWPHLSPSTKQTPCSFGLSATSQQYFFSQNKPAISNQPAVLFSQNKSAPAISHQPNEQAESLEQLINNNNTPVASSMVMPSFQ
jgi:hypothetical protein